ncbi:MAG: MotA/TolQ/ExbB proton channel family protein, partial [Bdellovibrionaceae bacterium]|nr:MotA/TolQ/ExbB proton channel family protein [Pseudobdellovibrionaceae bacterium]
MLTEKLFNIAQGGAEAILWILLALSVISVALIVERWLTLRHVRNNSSRIKTRLRDALQSHHLNEIEEIGKDRDTLEGRALSYGLRHVKENGASGLEEI